MTPMIVAVSSRSTQPEPNSSLDVELIAICAVGKALSSLTDPEARLRVLEWANTRFGPISDSSPQPAAAPVLPAAVLAPVLRLAAVPESRTVFELEVAAEACLRVDDLDDLFDTPTHPAPPAAAEDRDAAEDEDSFAVLEDSFAGIEDSFAEIEESPVVLEDQTPASAGVDDLSDVYETPAEAVRQLHLVTSDEQVFDQLVDDLVDSLHLLTRECLGAPEPVA